MRRFTEEHQIRLIVDAAHPFASRLHETIMTVAEEAQIPVVRYERIYPPRDPDITWIDDYSQIPTDIHTLLATTGVQSISKLKPLEAKGMKIWYRILPRESSISLAKAQGATDDQICFYEDGNTIDVDADAILLKESGLSGGFLEKVAAARAKGMRVIALKRPDIIMWNEECVNGPYGLRRAVEHLLPEFFPLHSGLTTGTCATAATVAAAIRLLTGETPSEVPVILPDGETIHVPVTYGSDYASVFKESGDDPDVTNGIEVRARVEHSDHFEIVGGEGVGRFTLPGFDFPPGSPAINKAPREMIARNLDAQCIASISPSSPLRVTISVPQGAEIARRTFNPRLGIEGGISIIGVSGIVKPFSEEAFISSIRKCMEVAKASGTARVVINSGAKSERFLKALYPDLPSQAFVEYGNYIGETLKIANELNIQNVTLGVMLGKAVKLAAGHLDTHSKRSTMDIGFISQMLSESGIDIDISDITLARELWEKIPAPQIQDFVSTVISHCENHCRPLLPNGQLTIMLVDDNGRIMT
jgi:cobalt-precorrin-5B (C1)-methyltransferase